MALLARLALSLAASAVARQSGWQRDNQDDKFLMG
jgi:hypothetical protein